MTESYDDLCAELRDWLDINPDSPPILLHDLANMLAKEARRKGGHGMCDSFMVAFAEFIDAQRKEGIIR